MIAEARRIVRFLAVGLLNTAVGYASYALFVETGTPLWLAVTGSTTVAVLFNFYSYGGLVFGGASRNRLPSFLIFYAFLCGLNFLVLRLLIAAGLGPLVAQAVLVPLLTVIGYFGLRQVVFTD